MDARICYVHVGTHKTGTTSIQRFLAFNSGVLRCGDILIPETARPGAHDGHHNVPWELTGYVRFQPGDGGFDLLLAEIARAGARIVCISSEEFSLLHSDGNALRRLRDGLASIGYQMRIVIYLRPQLDFARAMAAELLRQGSPRTLASVLDECLDFGAIGTAPRASLVEYDKLLDAFAAAAGRENLVVRAYPRSHEPAQTLISNFFGIIREHATFSRNVAVTVPSPMNVSTSSIPDERAILSRYADAMLARFNPHREATLDRYGIDVPIVGEALATRSLAAIR